MSDMNDIKRICDLTGVSYDEAKEAYADAKGDYYLAVGNIQRRHNNNDSRRGSTAGNASNIQSDIQSGFAKFLSSELLIGKDKTFSIPLILAAIVAVFGFEIALPAAIIAFFCGVRFTFTGPLFRKDVVLGFTNNSQPQKEPEVRYTNNTAYSSQNSYKAEYQRQTAQRAQEQYEQGYAQQARAQQGYAQQGYAQQGYAQGYTRSYAQQSRPQPQPQAYARPNYNQNYGPAGPAYQQQNNEQSVRYDMPPQYEYEASVSSDDKGFFA